MSEVLFDTWAWWEVFMGERTGQRLAAKYLARGRVSTSAWALGELASKLEGRVDAEVLDQALRRIHGAGRVLDVDARIAVQGAGLSAALRKRDPRASLGDGVMLATARTEGLRLVSGDAAFQGQPDVLRS